MRLLASVPCAVWAATLLVASVASAAPESPRTTGATLNARGAEVIVQSGWLSVRVHQTRLEEVLKAVAREAGLEIALYGAFDAPVTETFANLPLDEGIRRLCRGHSIVMVYDGPAGGEPGSALSKVGVLSSSSDPRVADRAIQDVQRNAGHAEAGAPLPRPPDLTLALRLGPPDSRTKIIDALVAEQGVDAVVRILREAATRDPDFQIRRSATEALGSMVGPDALEAIRAALNDRSATVRSAANLALQQQQHYRRQLTDGSRE
jgi:HEAT repeat protein